MTKKQKEYLNARDRRNNTRLSTSLHSLSLFSLLFLFPGEGVLVHLVVCADEVHLQPLPDVLAELLVVAAPVVNLKKSKF